MSKPQQDPEVAERPPASRKYTKLPAQIRPEDMRTSQDVRPPHPEKGEHDRETEWMLRTTGIFI